MRCGEQTRNQCAAVMGICCESSRACRPSDLGVLGLQQLGMAEKSHRIRGLEAQHAEFRVSESAGNEMAAIACWISCDQLERSQPYADTKIPRRRVVRARPSAPDPRRMRRRRRGFRVDSAPWRFWTATTGRNGAKFADDIYSCSEAPSSAVDHWCRHGDCIRPGQPIRRVNLNG